MTRWLRCEYKSCICIVQLAMLPNAGCVIRCKHVRLITQYPLVHTIEFCAFVNKYMFVLMFRFGIVDVKIIRYAFCLPLMRI